MSELAGAILILFYQSSSSLTKYKADVKARLEDHFREGGQRSAAQVRVMIPSRQNTVYVSISVSVLWFNCL